ncbi:MAG: alpha/beta hydrolase domain-containing protein [Bradyrhizobium sp.]
MTWLAAASCLAIGVLAAAPDAHARITQIQILTRGTAFGSHSFAGVGQYEFITGIATGEVDPNNPQNSLITDIQLAPKNAQGHVVYKHNFYILQPLDPSKGNHKMMYEPPNRGGKTYQTLNNTPTGTNDPAALTDATVLDDSFLWTRGYITAWSGWENNLGPLSGLTATASLPIVGTNPSNPVTGPGYEYIVSPPGGVYTLVYPPASADQSKATLTHRVHLDDPPQVVPSSGWTYVNATSPVDNSVIPNGAIQLVGSSFVANDIYEFTYTAKNPTVNGLGFAAIRDFNSFLRFSSHDDFGTPNPINTHISRIYTETSSQPARTLNDFVHLGFNEDESHRQVFDGMMQWIGAGDGINMNYRWSQTKRTNRNRQELLYLEGLYPFANVPTFDPISGTSDWRYRRCEETHTCPLATEFYSANEFWVKAGSLMSTDPTGRFDLPDHPLTRNYLLSSKQHGGAGNPATKGLCQQFNNPLDSAPVQRALWIDLDEWSTGGIQPPASQVPLLRDHTLVPPTQSSVGFPSIPGVTYTGLKTTRYRFNMGPDFYKTFVPTINPPVFVPNYEDNPADGRIYPSFVPRTDNDGNDIAGIRLPELVVPLATYTGWGLRSGVWANDGCEATGQYIPFQSTKAGRMTAGDPRPSVQERYPSFDEYRAKVVVAVDNLVRNRFLICDDTQDIVNRLLQAGITAGVPAPTAGENASAPDPVPACRGHMPPHYHYHLIYDQDDHGQSK